MTKPKRAWLIFGVAVLAGFFYLGIWPFLVGGGKMQAFCESLAKDSSPGEVRAAAGRHGYGMSGPHQEGRAFIHDSASLGRFICDVQFDQERLVSTRYLYND